MKITFKFLLWEVSFNLNHKKNKDRIEYLATKLFEELESQGYNVCGVGKTKFAILIKHEDGELHIDTQDKETIIITKQLDK